ncbi:fumarate reductase subunit FrdD [Planosporangium flavigriseum]|uniref:Fumarate reductase subunit D n=1 Tax=Planosporangium flavigriseum TaxID=373681 RepID=A0A8J3M1P9_9ACTN|nr:fumarate reductase subunit D [Planosporangium flavigriseum]
MLWLAFSAGGMLSALLVPVLLLLFGLAFPLGLLPAPDHAHLHALVRSPVTRLVLLALTVLALFHAAHRLRYTVRDGLQLKRLERLVDALCYGGAVAGSALAAYLLATIS